MALAEDLQVQRQHQRAAMRRLGAVDQAFEIDADAAVKFSLQGASGTVPFGENISPTALKSGLLNGYSHIIGFDMFNSGPEASWEIETAPAGSWANRALR